VKKELGPAHLSADALRAELMPRPALKVVPLSDELQRALAKADRDLSELLAPASPETPAGVQCEATIAAAQPAGLTDPSFVCESCGSALMDCGILGVECPNRHCPETLRLMRGMRTLFSKQTPAATDESSKS